MRRRLTVACAVAVLSAVPAPRAGAEAHDGWRGTAVLNGGKRYVDTPMGQVHVRDIGPRNTASAVLLLHQTPMSMVEFGAIQHALSARGVRSIAVDTPGYGTSDHPPFAPSIVQFADNLVPVLDTLGVREAVVAGHHTGVTIALSFAARHPDRTRGVVSHGAPFFERADADRFAALPLYDRTPKADGDHLSRFFRSVSANDASAVNLGNVTWMVVTMFQQGADTGHPAVYAHDSIADVAALCVPGLILTDVADGLHPFDQKLAAARPDWAFQVFSNGRAAPLALMNEPDRWADAVTGFVRGLDRPDRSRRPPC